MSPLPWSLVSVVGSEKRDGLRLYHIEVKPLNGDKPFKLKKRYNMFAYLNNEVKPLLKKKIPFPGKVGGGAEKRSRDLDAWLANIVSTARDDDNLSLRPLLYEFLSERTADLMLKQTPFADKSIAINGVKLPYQEERDGTTWFAVDILSAGLEPYRIWKTYRMFLHLKQETGFNRADFPKKSIAKCSGEALTERRKSLDYWMTALIENSETNQEMTHLIQDFLVPRNEESESDVDEEISESEKPEISAIRLTEVGERGGGVYYKVEVISYTESGPATYVLWKRFRQFAKLCEMMVDVCHDAGNDFPPKSIGKSGVEGRKRGLDFWMTSVLGLSKTSQGVHLKPLLETFLNPSQKVESAFDSSSLVEVTKVSLPSYDDREGTTFYQIRVELSTDEIFVVSKSYSMFYELCKSCGHVVLGKAAENGFPSKTILKVTSKESLDQRHRQLAAWFLAMFERSLTDDYKVLRPVLREFLDSTHV
eukprot:TRINITY_DN13669_c0_g1_i1.p1 TRINITY_DN13669_c0_g1~~TRINITY_DN13669_c0_g1_i1.p1  ORF type:complete len:478 (+),score=47.52 TRINITY_DN13669_c0_g1_i1:45-1478(+)